MRIDLDLFHSRENRNKPSVLRFYSWQPQCISLGYSQKIEEEVDLLRAKELGWEMVRRPTGGGIVFHNEAEVTYSLVTAIDNPILPKGMIPSYKRISEAVVLGLKYLGINAQVKAAIFSGPQSPAPSSRPLDPLCFSYPAEYEVVCNGRKIVGSAQKRGRRSLLQQGSVFVRNNDPSVFSLLKQPVKEYNAVSVEEVLERAVGFEEIAQALQKGFEECFGIKFV